MDTLTHIVLGGCIGEATARRQLGKKAIWLGAIAQSLPDIDFVAYFFLGKTENLLAHRGITHSFLFVVVISFFLVVTAYSWLWKGKAKARTWALLASVNLIVHVMIDSLNAYGVGWLEPFSDHRYSFHVLYVADPFFSIIPFIGFLLILALKNEKWRRAIWTSAIAWVFLYTGYAWSNKTKVDADLRKDLARNGIRAEDYVSTPTPLNSWLWFVIVKYGDGYFTGYRSVFDTDTTHLTYRPINASLMDSVKDKNDLKNLVRFSNGHYTLEQRNDTVVFNILRFGQVAGWFDPYAKFAFHYYLDKPGANSMLVQRGRFQNWNRATFQSFIRRIKGE